ncbi:GNAT family N-acetyltransferase [Vibrio hannami]|uniref:GNAT family N-acetyltransferase n=1 Tax=Vibrio hannami TaxID=2717094 RepID=UPI0024101B87|nr:GNAT family N-acetyltransferase [Vibrio hannami]MDG3087757.1 GNAT family N-acetyltransferase [Vibrio hannami]
MRKQPKIKTKRLILTPVVKTDLDIYKALLTSPEVTKYLPGGKPFSEEYIANYLQEKVAHWGKGYGTFIVSLADAPNTKIGYAGVETIPDNGLDDIRYGLLPEYQSKGYAFEAAKVALEFTFRETNQNEIYGVAVTDNLPSARLLEKLGMRPAAVRLYDSDDLITMSIQRDNCLSPNQF